MEYKRLAKDASNLMAFSCDGSHKRFGALRLNRALRLNHALVLIPLAIIVLIAIIFAKWPLVNATPQTITTPGITVTIDPSSAPQFELTPGLFNTKTQSLTISTTSVGGYTVNMTTGGYEYTDNNSQTQTILTTDLVNTSAPTDTTKRIPTLTANTTSANFNNNFGYYFATGSNVTLNDTTTYKPIPAINAGVSNTVELAKTTSSNTTPNDYTLTFAIETDFSVPAGTYQNTVLLNITANISPYTIIFNGNGGETGTNATYYNQAIGVGVPTTLTPNAFTRTDYVFTGWNTEADGTGNTYIDQYDTTSGEVENASAGATINLYAQWRKICEPNKICYEDNGANSNTTMSKQTVAANATEAMLWPSNFKYQNNPNQSSIANNISAGYGFAGWSTDENAVAHANDNNPANDPIIYGPMETIDLTKQTNFSTEGLVLYAVWIKSTGDLQNWGGCSTLTRTTYDSTNGTLVASLNSITALTDTRDGNTYAIARLADGNCWFIENLRLGGTTNLSLTTGETDINTDVTLTYANTFSGAITDKQFTPRNLVATVTNLTDPANENVFSYGGYYDWSAAIGTSTAYSSGSVNTSICPRGWRLPAAGNGGDTDVLNNAINGGSLTSDKNLRAFPANYNYNGYIAGASVPDRNIKGRYQTSTSIGADNMYTFAFAENVVQPATGNGAKMYGRAIRCLARESYTVKYNSNGGLGEMNDQTFFIGTSNTFNTNTFISSDSRSFKEWNTEPDGSGTSYPDGSTIPSGTNLGAEGETINLYAIWVNDITSISNMQDMTSSLCANTAIGTETILKDTRDNKTYYVARLADGKCWMTQNLDLDLSASAALTAEKSDLPANRTWTPENATQTTEGITWTQLGTEGARSMDPGDVSIANGVGTGTADSNYNQTIQSTDNVHYQIGNYYNWNAATAGTGLSNMTSGDTSDSICPKGWRLPTGTATTGDFAKLLNAYSIGDNATGGANVVKEPLYFLRSGLYLYTTSKISYLGNVGAFWSSTAYTSPYTLILWVGVSKVNAASNVSSRGNGFSIRCVTRDTYTINFDANGGSGAMPSQTGYRDQATELNARAFTNGNEEFRGWNTRADGGGTTYSDKEAVTNLADANGSITLYAQWGCPAEKICYFDNDAASETKMVDQSATSNTEAILWPSNFKRSGYGFAGWSEDKNVTNSSTIYGPMQTLTASEVGDLSTSGKKLYAVWVPSTGDLQNWAGCLDLTPASYTSGVLNANLSSITALTDTRDNNTYAIARLTDGNCWFIENLRLGNANGTISLTSDNTDVTANIVLPKSATTFSDSVTAIQQNSINTDSTVSIMSDLNSNIYSYGNYYTFAAAIGTTAAYSSGSATTSICPKGWQLPTGGVTPTTSKSFSYLDTTLGGTGTNASDVNAAIKYSTFPINMMVTGRYTNSSISWRGANGGVYWTSTAVNASYGYTIRVNRGGDVGPGTYADYYKYYGLAVRCVARDAFRVAFDSNGGTGTMNETGAIIGNSVTLPGSTFTAPTGKSFIGWNTKADGSGTSYTVGANVTEADIQTATGSAYNSQTNNTLTLYAQYGVTIENIGTMQEMASALCDATPTPLASETNVPQVQLRDTRDNKVYYVAKLADGKCWMTQNLDLDLSASAALLSADTDLNSKASWTPDNDTQTTNGDAWAITVAHSYDHGDAYLENGTGSGTESGNSNYPVLDTGDSHYHLGNLYNWAAATAGSGASTAAAGSAPDSICPKGWRLPTGGNSGELNALTTAYGVTNNTAGNERMRSAPLYFVHSGYYHGTNYYITGRGVSGRWHSSNSYNSTNQWMMMVASRTTFVQPAYNQTEKRHGVAVRCVAADNYMVEFDSNGGSGTMATQSVRSGVAAVLNKNTFVAPAGKVFNGWNTKSDGTGEHYADGGLVTDLAATDGVATLYAEWGIPLETAYANAGKQKYNGYYRMQDMNSAVCAATTIIGEAGSATLIDIRDNKLYTAAKLADDKCWMTSNLRLGDNSGAVLDNSTSDLNTISTFTLPASAGGRWDVNDKTHFYNYDGNWLDDSNTLQTTGTPPSEDRYIGNYYDWYSATAGTGKYAMTSGNTSDSICPKGWRLPTGGNNSDFTTLKGSYGDVNDLISEAKLIKSGMYHPTNTRVQDINTHGSWLSSTPYSTGTYIYHMAYNTSASIVETPRYTLYRYTGVSIRCVVRENYTVQFNANGGSGTMSDQLINSGVATNLKTNGFTAPSGKVFTGWNTAANGSGTSYANSASVANLTSVGGTITLYAQWEKTLVSISDMQELTTGICNATPTPSASATNVSQYRLKDTRDNKYYFVAKLADGKCWMTQNLDLELSTTMTLTSADSDISAGRTWKPENNTQTTDGIVWDQTGTDGGRSYDSGAKYFANGYGTGTKDTNGNYMATNIVSSTPTAQLHYSLGNYYNWLAATAGTGTPTMTSGVPSDSICPKGWRLPSAGSGSEYENLLSVYGISNDATGATKVLAAPLYFVRSGMYRYTVGDVRNQGDAGIWSSNTIFSDTGIQMPYFTSDQAYALHSGSKGMGFSVRCVGR